MKTIVFLLFLILKSINAQNLTTEQLFSRYLVSGDTQIGKMIAEGNDSIYSFFCKARAEKDMATKKYFLSVFLNRNPAFGAFEAHIERGSLYEYLQQYDSSLADLNKAVSLSPDNAYGYYFRGVTYSKLSKINDAISDLTKAVSIDKNFYLAFQMRGNIYMSDSIYVSAIEDYSKVIALNKNYELAYYTRGICYLKIKESKKAIKDLEKVIQLNPKYKEKAEKLIEKAKNITK